MHSPLIWGFDTVEEWVEVIAMAGLIALGCLLAMIFATVMAGWYACIAMVTLNLKYFSDAFDKR